MLLQAVDKRNWKLAVNNISFSNHNQSVEKKGSENNNQRPYQDNGKTVVCLTLSLHSSTNATNVSVCLPSIGCVELVPLQV